MIVIISCGKSKRSERCPAGEMYTGVYHRKLLAYAKTLTTESQILILSAKYGLLRLHEEIDPYELKLGQRGSISTFMIRDQARKMMILDTPIIMLGGAAYARICQRIFENIATPLARFSGIGLQMQFINERIKECHQES